MPEPGEERGRMAVAGNERLRLAFAALGFEPVACADGKELSAALRKLQARHDVFMVVCGEGQASEAREAVEQFRAGSEAILMTVPDSVEELGLDAEAVRKEVEMATGVDLLGKNKTM